MNRYIFHIIAFWLYNTAFDHAFLSKKHYIIILSYFLNQINKKYLSRCPFRCQCYSFVLPDLSMLIYVSHRASLHQPCMKLHRTYLYAAFYLMQGEKCSFSNVKSVLINSCQRRNAAFGNGQIVIACDAYILRNTIACFCKLLYGV